MGDKQIALKELLDFHEKTLGISDDEKRSIACRESIDFDEYRRRIVGKEKETEFLIFMKSLRSVKHIDIVDEERAKKKRQYTPDYEVELSDDKRLLLEVKHTEKGVFRISGGNLQQRMDYAKTQGLALRFVISINGLWGDFTADYVKSKGGKIELADYTGDKAASWLGREFDTCSYLFHGSFEIVSVYEENTSDGLGVKFAPYGELISYELFFEGTLIFSANKNDRKYLLHVIILEALHDKLANSLQEIKTIGKLTTIVERNVAPRELLIQEIDFFMAIIRHRSFGNKNKKDNIFLAAEEEPLVRVEHVRMVMEELYKKGVNIICVRDGSGWQFDDFRKEFWIKRVCDIVQ